MSPRRWLHALSRRFERAFDGFAGPARRRHARRGALELIAAPGFGTDERLMLSGRVLRRRKPRIRGRSNVLSNLVASYRRFVSRELPGVRVRARFGQATSEAVTDAEGYFRVDVDAPGMPDRARLWHRVELELPDRPDQPATHGNVLVPPDGSELAVVSDIDDTVIVTHTHSLIAMARLTLLRDAGSRLPFPGVGAFYRALARGARGQSSNPLFYVSSSPWNIYDLLKEILERHALPAGPLMLRDIGIDEEKFIGVAHGEHKRAAIERLLVTYPDLPFVLIGDSTQHDAEVYARIARARPDRIRAIYIRSLRRGKRDDEARAVAAQITELGVPMLLSDTSVAAAEHAATLGLIEASSLEEIRADADDVRRARPRTRA